MVSKKEIERIITETIQDYNTLNTKCSIIKSSPYYQQAVAMSEKYGLKLKKCTKTQLRFEETGHINPLNDRITSTEIRFDNMLNDGHIDFTNEHEDKKNGIYSMDTLLGYYSTMPFNLKSSVGAMVFEPTDEANHSAIYDPYIRKENVVTITNEAYRTDVGEDWNPERIMAHEMGHCLEMGQLTEEERRIFGQNLKKLDNGDDSYDDVFFEEKILPKMHIYSRDIIDAEEYADSFGEDVPYFDDYEIGIFAEAQQSSIGGIPSKYGSDFKYLNNYTPSVRYSEHFAETVSMISFRDKEDKSNAKMRCVPNPYREDTVVTDYDQFLTGKLPNQYMTVPKSSYSVVEKLLFGDNKIEGLSEPKPMSAGEFLAQNS